MGTVEQLNAEKEKVQKELRQLENRQKTLLNKQRDAERRARTRRLIERGAIVEGVFSLASDLSGEKVKAFLIALLVLQNLLAVLKLPDLLQDFLPFFF